MNKVQRIPLDSESPRRATFSGVLRHLPPGAEPGGSKARDFSDLTEKVLIWAKELGFVRAGIASLDPFVDEAVRFEAFLSKGRAGEMRYLGQRNEDGSLLRRDPRVVFPSAQVALVVALSYPAPQPTAASAPNMIGRIAAYAGGSDYHHVVKERLLLIADRLAEHLGEEVVARPCVDSAPLLERDLARRAGFAFLGKNTLAIAPGAGSHFVLGELLLALPLVPNVTAVHDGCGSCTACLDACPTGAFVGPYQLDATKCISYLTIESRAPIPAELRTKLEDHLFGCDECQAVCPYNRSGHRRSIDWGLTPRSDLAQLSAAEALALTSSSYKKLVRGTALSRASRNQLARNAAVVLGNSGNETAVEVLSDQARSHISWDVRLHCVWALGELAHTHGSELARLALDELTTDQDERLAKLAMLALDSESFKQSSRAHAASDTHGDHGEAPFSSG